MREIADGSYNRSQVLSELHTTGAVNFENDGKNAPTTATSLVERIGQEHLPLYEQPSPPLTCKPKDQETLIALRRRRFKSECQSSPKTIEKFTCSSSNIVKTPSNNAAKSGSRKNPFSSEISVNDFTVGVFSRSEGMKWAITYRDEEEICEDQVKEEAYGVEGKEKEEKRTENFSRVNKAGSSSGMIKLTRRKQSKPSVELGRVMSHYVSTETHFCQLNKEKQRFRPSSLDSFARRLASNEKFCRENMQLTDKPVAGKDLDIIKKTMINNWLIGVSMDR